MVICVINVSPATINKGEKQMTKKWYVSCTDKFMSGWGKASGKINKLVFECDSWDQAKIVADNAEAREDQKHINIRSSKPYYPQYSHCTQYKTIADYESWYKPGYFAKARA